MLSLSCEFLDRLEVFQHLRWIIHLAISWLTDLEPVCRRCLHCVEDEVVCVSRRMLIGV